jgi:beta-glucosidase
MSPDMQNYLAQLTLEEKAALAVGLDAWRTVPVERLGIPSIIMSDGPHGVRRVSSMADRGLPATCFPTASALAATWNLDLVDELGKALAEECIALGVDILLGPGNNMKRTPLCGRNFEYFSEDPFLGTEMAIAFIKAVQSQGIGTSLKHYAANNQETLRKSISAEMDERTLHEIYLAAFKRVVEEAKPWTVMCSYNRVHGIHASENRMLLSDILKDMWGFEGVVVSDWGAVHNRARALQAGLDLEMPGPQEHRVKRLVDAVQRGEVDEACLDASVERILRLVFQAVQTPKGGREIAVEAHHALARKIASEAAVLLKNEGGMLPLSGVSRVAVIGLAAKEPHFQGGGSSHITPTKVDIPLDELQKAAPEVEFLYAPGYTLEEGIDQTLIDEAVRTASDAEAALVFVGLPDYKDAEGRDRADMLLSEQQEALLVAVTQAQPRSAVILNNGSALDMRAWIDQAAAVLEAWLPGQAGGGAAADIVFGIANPSGKLAESFPYRLEDTPAYLNLPGENGKVRYGEGIFIGYRYYDAKHVDVLFPFGHGLSYTTFELSNLQLSTDAVDKDESFSVGLDVTNTGDRAGQAVIQLYVHDRQSRFMRPPKELKGFVKIVLQPGETRHSRISLDPQAFQYYHPGQGGWVTEPGEFDILVGQSSAGPFLQQALAVTGPPLEADPLTMDSTLQEWLMNRKGADLLQDLLLSMFSQFESEMGEHQISFMEAVEWAKEEPLENVLAFWGRGLPAAPEEMVAQMLTQVNQSV